MHTQREMLYILVLVGAVFGFQTSQARVFIGDNVAPGILWSELPNPIGDFNILDQTFNLIQLRGGTWVSSIAYDEREELVYWCDMNSNSIRRIQMDGFSQENLIETEMPIDITLDLVNRRIYWISYGTNRLGSADLDPTVPRLNLAVDASPVSILVNPSNEYILWSEHTDRTLQADLSGGNKRTVKSGDTLRGMVDEQCGDSTTRLYYISELGNALGFTNLDHGTDEILTVFQDEVEVARTLTKYSSKLFWVYERTDLSEYIYEYDLASSTLRILRNNTVVLQNGTTHDFSPRSIFIHSNMSLDQAVMIEDCPKSITVSLDEGSTTTPVSWPEPKLNSLANCPSMDFVGDFPNGGNFSGGVFDLSYNASDALGNTDVCSFTVSVLQGECELNIDNCDVNAMCTNIPDGTFTCTCNEGYTGDGTSCTEGAPTTPTSIPTMTTSDCDGDESGSGSTLFSFAIILRALGIAFLFIITLK